MRFKSVIFIVPILTWGLISENTVHSVNFTQEKLPETKLVWHWKDNFDESDKLKVQTWINKVFQANELTLGAFPFDVHVHIYSRPNSKEPVPWANTWKYPEQSLHFYIDTAYTLDDFLNDWTAPHEMSHLTLPYLGEKNAWFAEGYASFMQYQIMMNMGIYTQEEINLLYAKKIALVKPYFQSAEDCITLMRSLREQKNYSVMYWGGATYFFTLNKRLIEKHQRTLMDLIQEYQVCCRTKDHSLADVIESLDKMTDDNIASSLLADYSQLPAEEIINQF